MKNTYPILLIIKGDAQAYSPVQIEDKVKKHLGDLTSILFDDYPPHYLRIGEPPSVVTTSGMPCKDLEDRVAHELFWFDREVKRRLAERLLEVSKMFWDESGIIFTDVKAVKASHQLKRLANELKAETSLPSDGSRWGPTKDRRQALSKLNIPEENKGFYYKSASALLDNTFEDWKSQLILPNDLMDMSKNLNITSPPEDDLHEFVRQEVENNV